MFRNVFLVFKSSQLVGSRPLLELLLRFANKPNLHLKPSILNGTLLRKQFRSADSSAGHSDSFVIEPAASNVYKVLDDEELQEVDGNEKKKGKPQKKHKLTNKSCFRTAIASVGASEIITTCYRFRWEKIGGNVKAAKPYVVVQKAITLKPKTPTLAPYLANSTRLSL